MTDQTSSYENFLNLPEAKESRRDLTSQVNNLELQLQMKKQQLQTTQVEQQLLNDFCNQLFAIESRAIASLKDQLLNSETAIIKRHIQDMVHLEQENAKIRLKTRMISEKMHSDARIEAKIQEEESQSLKRLQESLEKESRHAAKRLNNATEREEIRVSELITGRLAKLEATHQAKLKMLEANLLSTIKEKKRTIRKNALGSFLKEKEKLNLRFQEKQKELQSNADSREKFILEAEKEKQKKEINEKLDTLKINLKKLHQQNAKDTEQKLLALRKRHIKKIEELKKFCKEQMEKHQRKLEKEQSNEILLYKEQIKLAEAEANKKYSMPQTELNSNKVLDSIRPKVNSNTLGSDHQKAAISPEQQKQLTSKLIVSSPERVKNAISCFNEEEQCDILALCSRFTRSNILNCVPELSYLVELPVSNGKPVEQRVASFNKFIELL